MRPLPHPHLCPVPAPTPPYLQPPPASSKDTSIAPQPCILQPHPHPKGCSSPTRLGRRGCLGQPLPPGIWYLFLRQDASSFSPAARFPNCSERRRGRTPFLSRVSCQLLCSLWPSGPRMSSNVPARPTAALCSADLGLGCCGAGAQTLLVAWETAGPLAHEDHSSVS